MINIEKVKNLQRVLAAAAHDPLMKFVTSDVRDQLEEEQKNNLDTLFAEAKKYKVRYLYVGRGEIAGCEDKDDQPGHDHAWPAMWAIAKNVGFPGSCGNSDQYQCIGSELVFPSDAYGGWDLKTMTKLDDDKTEKMKFARVVTRKRDYR